jgi:DNA repair protein RecN (Recombination protein N)
MLDHLSVQGFAIIDALELPLGPGMTVLTGETGAGKSIVVDALSLLVGERARTDVIRTGSDECALGAQFHVDLALRGDITTLLADEGLPPLDDGALVVRRILSRSGRHRQFVNGALATVAQLKSVLGRLVDFTGQHAEQALLRPRAQLDILDAFGDHDALTALVRTHHAHARALALEQTELTRSEKEKLDRADYLRFQLDEIAGVEPIPGEDESLAAERTKLLSAGRFRQTLAAALAAISSDDGDDALSRVQTASREVERLVRDLPELGDVARTLDEAATLLDDAVREIEKRGAALHGDPERLAVVDDRLDAIRKLVRKHGPTVERVLQARDEMAAELARIEGAEARLSDIERLLAAELKALGRACDELSQRRREAATRLARGIAHELQDLGMKGARIEVSVEPLPVEGDTLLTGGTPGERRALTERGQDRVEIRLAANAGEPMGPIAKMASGGELSRVLLATKRVLLAKDPVPLSIFDEVDTGVGGATGEIIAEKLRAIADGRQVIAVTHLAQVAAFADRHLAVSKDTVEGRTITRVTLLDDDARVRELARMAGGRALTDVTFAHARDLLDRARQTRSMTNTLSTDPVTTTVATAAPHKTPKGPRRVGATTP